MVNYAVVGCGVIGKVHCSAIMDDPNGNLLFVCDIDTNKADKMAELFNCESSYNYSELLINHNVDVITICLPHFKHIELFEKALEHGKHVLCEKPLATTPTDIYKMVELTEQIDLKTTAAFQHRHSALIIKLKELVDRGIFGDILSGDLNFSCDRSMDYYNTGFWRGRWDSEGGGTLINQAIHTIDLANLFLGKPQSLTGKVENRSLPEIEVEDYALGSISYEKNRTLLLDVKNSKGESWKPFLTITGSLGSFTINGSDSIVELNIESEHIHKELTEIELMMKDDKPLPGKTCYGNLHNILFSDFSEAIIENRKPLLSIKEASLANEIVLGFYNSTSKAEGTVFPIKEYEQPNLTLI
ncbi:MAG: Gfo/Idh/MocA family oxidoreductase [Spirochaetaceae bacterium]